MESDAHARRLSLSRTLVMDSDREKLALLLLPDEDSQPSHPGRQLSNVDAAIAVACPQPHDIGHSHRRWDLSQVEGAGSGRVGQGFSPSAIMKACSAVMP